MTLTSFLTVSAQKDIVFGLDKDFTKRRLKSDNPYVYSVTKSNYVIEKKTRVKKKSEKYEALKLEINDFENHMVTLNEAYEQDLAKYNGLSSVVNNITDFLNSHKPVESSRSVLIESQEILNSFNVNKLVYADNNVSSNKKVKFLMLSSNRTNLKLHLKKVVKEIEDLNIKPLSLPSEDELALMREELETMKPYVVVAGPIRKKKVSGLVLNTKVNNVPTEISGEFVEVDDYTVMVKDYNSEFKKGRLIKKDLAIKKSFIKKGYAKAENKKLIKSTLTKKLYIVDGDFFKKFAFTFNGKFRYQAKNLISQL